MARRVAKLNPTKHHKGIAADNEERYSTHKDPQRLLCSSYTCGLLFALCPINGPCHDQAQILQPLLEPWLSDRMKSQFLLEAFCALPQASLQKYVLPGDVKTFLCRCTCGMAFLCHHSCILPSTNLLQLSRLLSQTDKHNRLVHHPPDDLSRSIKLLH